MRRRATAEGKGNKKERRKIAAPKERARSKRAKRSKEASALEASEKGLDRDRVHRHGEQRLELLEGDRKVRTGIDFVCGSGGVPEDGGGSLRFVNPTRAADAHRALMAV